MTKPLPSEDQALRHLRMLLEAAHLVGSTVVELTRENGPQRKTH